MSKRIAVYPGSFDPITNGHLDIIRRALRIFDGLIVAVAHNPQKKPHLPTSVRLDLLRNSLQPYLRRKVLQLDTFDGLLVRYAKRKKACAVIRGLRAVSDFEYEFQMALMNRSQDPDIETVFLMADEKYTYLSSTLIKEILRLGGRPDRFVPPQIVEKIRKNFRP
ncbi:MAG TPA: pantetheine-phosphate adenylyltransferase [Elusimicrobiota bacterium]|nr:pantetheine-phosphate adenylyltransferase [Elusimicrobiota bacterium]